MAKTASLNVRMEPEVKERAEAILETLGIPASNAIDMFYRQIILNKGLPFEVKIPETRPLDISLMTSEELNAELEKGYASVQAGRVKDVDEAFEAIYRKIEDVL